MLTYSSLATQLMLTLVWLKHRSNCGNLGTENETGQMNVDPGLWLLQCGDIEENPGPKVQNLFFIAVVSKPQLLFRLRVAVRYVSDCSISNMPLYLGTYSTR